MNDERWMQVIRRSPGRDTSWGYALLVLTCAIATMAAILRGLVGAWTPGTLAFLAVAFLTVLGTRLLRPLPERTVVRRERVTFSGRGIAVIGARFIERTRIARAYIATDDGGVRTLHCRDDHGQALFEADVSDAADAEAILEVLGFDPRRRQELDRLAARLGRGERALASWQADLARHREGAYRDAPIRDEDLWRVVEDPGTAEDARAAAALLLCGRDGAPPRLRIVADEVVSPRLRVALRAAAEPQVDAGQILEGFDDAPRRKQAGGRGDPE